jgi:flagellar biosynthesis/type III secretory pathway protein FliH
MTETPTPTPTEPTEPRPDPEPTPPEPDDELTDLDDRARRYVQTARSEAAAYRHERNELRQRAQTAEERLQALEREHESEQEKLVREAEERGRQEGQAEVDKLTADFQRQLATMAIKAKAADRFNDANDAVAALREAGTLDDLLSEPDERKRDQAVDKALADLLEAKPYLGRGERRPLVTQGGRSEQPNGRPRERSWLRG